MEEGLIMGRFPSNILELSVQDGKKRGYNNISHLGNGWG